QFDAEKTAKRLKIFESKLTRIHENQCNGYKDRNGDWDQVAADQDKRSENSHIDTLHSILDPLGIKFKINGDPLDYSIKMIFPCGFENSAFEPVAVIDW